MLEFQKVFLETLEDGISASSDFNILETPSQFRVSIFNVSFKQRVVDAVQSSPLRKKLVPGLRTRSRSVFLAPFPSGRWYQWGMFLSESQSSGSHGPCLRGDCDPAFVHV